MPTGACTRALFTDLDGTLLDEHTYRWDAAAPALAALRGAGAMVVLCSSKTFAELEVVQAGLGLDGPLIVENGGGIYFKSGQFESTGIDGPGPAGWRRVSLGIPHRALVAQLTAIQERTGIPLCGFSQMPPEAVAQACGLSLEEAERALKREFDEPFRLVSTRPEDLIPIIRLAERVGLRVLKGGRFHHLTGRASKGDAVRKVCAFLRRNRGPVRSAGVGDAPNDLSMLQAVDVPAVVMRPGGIHDPQVVAGVPHARLAQGIGPIGWNAAVLELLADGSW